MSYGCLIHFVNFFIRVHKIHTPHLRYLIIDVLHNLPFMSVIKTLHEIYIQHVQIRIQVTSKVEWGIFLRCSSGNNENNSSHMEIHVPVSVLFNWMADADGMVRNTIVHYRSVLKRKDKTRHVTIFTTSKKHSKRNIKRQHLMCSVTDIYALRMIMLTNIFTWSSLSSKAIPLIAVS